MLAGAEAPRRCWQVTGIIHTAKMSRSRVGETDDALTKMHAHETARQVCEGNEIAASKRENELIEVVSGYERCEKLRVGVGMVKGPSVTGTAVCVLCICVWCMANGVDW